MLKDKAKLQRMIASVLLALMIWGGLQLQGEASRRLSVPVEFLNVPEGLVVADPLVAKVGFTVRGVQTRMARLDPEFLKIRIDLVGSRAGSFKFLIGEDKIEGLPAGLKISDISPREMDVRLEPALEKDIPVEPRYTGKVAEDYLLDGASTVPAAIKFLGPRVIGETLTTIPTTKIDLKEARNSFTVKVPVSVEDRVIPFLKDTSVDVEVRVSEKVVARTVTGIIVNPQTPSGLRVKITPPQIDITVSGPVSKVKGLEAASFEVQADARAYSSGKHRKQELHLTIKVNPPRDGITFDYEPKTFDLQVTR